MVVRGARELLQRDIAVTRIRTKEIGGQQPAGRSGILVRGLEVRPIGNLVDVPISGQMPSDRSHIRDIEYRAKTDRLLNAEAPVHNRGYFARSGDCVDSRRELRLLRPQVTVD